MELKLLSVNLSSCSPLSSSCSACSCNYSGILITVSTPAAAHAVSAAQRELCSTDYPHTNICKLVMASELSFLFIQSVVLIRRDANTCETVESEQPTGFVQTHFSVRTFYANCWHLSSLILSLTVFFSKGQIHLHIFLQLHIINLWSVFIPAFSFILNNLSTN